MLFFTYFDLLLLVEIFADKAEGYINVITNGGNGIMGQSGADGRKGADSLNKVWKLSTSPHRNRHIESTLNDDHDGNDWITISITTKTVTAPLAF